nr:MAG TPA: hypothetical protein [Caudoviricetes sp.]
MSNVSVETLEKLRENMVGRRYRHFLSRRCRTYERNSF